VELCVKCGCPEQASAFLRSESPIDQVRRVLLEREIANRALTPDPKNDSPEVGNKTKKPDDKFGEEYDAQAGVYASMGIDRDGYIRSRRIDEGLEPLQKITL